MRYYDGRQNKEGGPFTRIHLSADFTQPICDAMEWGDPQDGAKSSKLEGSLSATNLIITPNGRELKQHEMQLNVQEIRDFTFVRGTTDEETGKVKADRLDFIAISVQPGAGALVESYIAMIGKGAGQLRVGYEEQSKMDLEKADPVDEDQRMISAEQAADTASDDEPELDDPAQPTAGPTLAPAALVGGTHQKGTRGRRPRNAEAEAIADGTAPLPGEVIN